MAPEVVATDLRGEAVLAPSMATLEGLPIRYVLGGTRGGFRPRRRGRPQSERAARLAVSGGARAAGARIDMEIAWFFRACRGKIAGITGTRGKGDHDDGAARHSAGGGMDPLLGGNMGGIETLSLLPQITPERWVVLEIGDWMCEGLHAIRRSPHLAIFTNVLPDHLDAFDSMDDYA